MKNMPISRKIAAGFSCVVAGVVAMCCASYLLIRNVQVVEDRNDLSSNVLEHVDLANAAMIDSVSLTRAYMLTGNDALPSRILDQRSTFRTEMQTIRKMTTYRPDFIPLIDDVTAIHDRFANDIIDPEIRLASDPATREQAVAMAQSGSASQRLAEFRAKVKALRGPVKDWSDAEGNAASALIVSVQNIMLFGSILTVSLAVLIGWALARMIARPVTGMTAAMQTLASGNNDVTVPATDRHDEIGKMAGAVQVFKEAAIAKLAADAEAAATRARAEEQRNQHESVQREAAQQQAIVVKSLGVGLEKLSQGNLVYRITNAFPGEYEGLRSNYNEAVSKLQETVRVILESTGGIRSGSSEIAQASDNLAKRTEQQAASLEETAAALDEITATVRRTAENAATARSTVTSTKADAEESGKTVRDAVQAMQEIESSSREIGQIIGMIDEIAFQTNLLALNAGVEAARAGDAGRGFAVVASEVRALAQRSAEAAREIKGLISSSGQQVHRGVDLVSAAGQALERIVGQVGALSGLVSDIAGSASEQATGLQEVNTAMNQMDQVTQQNAAMVEQSTAACQSLSREVGELTALMARFDVGETAHSTFRAAPAATARRPAAKPAPRHSAPATAGADDGWEEF